MRPANIASFASSGGFTGSTPRAHGDQVVIEIRDHGIKMVSALLERVFDLLAPGGRAARADVGFCPGSGRSLIESLLASYGGTVRASADSVDAGPCFVVRLPVSSGGEATRARRPAPRISPANSPMLDA